MDLFVMAIFAVVLNTEVKLRKFDKVVSEKYNTKKCKSFKLKHSLLSYPLRPKTIIVESKHSLYPLE